MGPDNFVASISFKTMMPLESGHIESVMDYLLWYAKDRERVKYRNLYIPKKVGPDSEFVFTMEADGSSRRMTPEEFDKLSESGDPGAIFKRSDLASSGYTPSCTFPIEFAGRVFETKRGKSWRTNREGIDRLISSQRLFVLGDKLYYRM
jgi:adenine-specific DNA-methyltransferase